jgi:hypothetical protein
VCVCVRELRGKIVEVYVVLKPGFSPSNEIEHKVSDAIEKEIGKIASEEREPGRAGCERDLASAGLSCIVSSTMRVLGVCSHRYRTASMPGSASSLRSSQARHVGCVPQASERSMVCL